MDDYNTVFKMPPVAEYRAILTILPEDDAATEEEAMWRAMLTDIPPAFVARWLDTQPMLEELRRRGVGVVRDGVPRAYPPLIDDEL